MGDALDELLRGLERLLEEQADNGAHRVATKGNFRCQRCEGCSDCRFCVDCTDCIECTYCEGCTACTACTQSKRCRDCERTSHSQLSRACDECSYVTLCIGCEACVHCFACVGLSGGEFCILNEKLDRKTYQAKIAELRVALERRLATGWRPAWLRDDDVDDDAIDATDVLEELDAPIRRDDDTFTRAHAVATATSEALVDTNRTTVNPHGSVLWAPRPKR